MPGRLRGISPVPGVPAEQVANFQHGFFLPELHGQPALADDPAGFLQYHGPQAEAESGAALQLPVQPGAHLFVGEGPS